MGVSVVIPVFNSEDTIEALCTDLICALPPLTASYEILLINDGSRDSSWNIIQQLSSQNRAIRGIKLLTNYGQHNALLCGIRHAIYEVIVTLDDDLQNPPAEIQKLISKLAEGNDVVYGSPTMEQHGLARDMASQITKLVLQHAMGAEIATKISSFRAFRAHLREGFSTYSSQSINIDVLLSWTTRKFAYVPVQHNPRRTGASSYSLGRLINHGLNLVTGFSIAPLQVASISGFVFMLFGLGVLLYVVIKFLIVGTTVPGFPFLASLIAMFAGVQLFALGIMGEYLARIYIGTLGRPPFVVDSMTTNAPESPTRIQPSLSKSG